MLSKPGVLDAARRRCHGFLGREICRRLAAEDHAVRGLTDAIPMEATLRDYPLRLRTVRQYAREVLGAP